MKTARRTLTTRELALLRSYHSSPPLTKGNCDTLAMNLGSPSPVPYSLPSPPSSPTSDPGANDAGPTGDDVPVLLDHPGAPDAVDAVELAREAVR